MGKKLSALLLIGCFMMLLWGCTATPTPAASPSPSPSPTATPLKVRTYMERRSSEILERMQRQYQNGLLNGGNHAALKRVMQKAQSGQDITLVILGGSISMSTAGGSTPSATYGGWLQKWFEFQFPDIKVNLVHSGIGNTGSFIGVHRFARDVAEHNPDVVVVEFSVNDADLTGANGPRDRQTYESVLRRTLALDSHPAVVMLSMVQQSGRTLQEEHQVYAQQYDLPQISFKNAIWPDIDNGLCTWEQLYNGVVHPNLTGHLYVGDLLSCLMQEVYDSLEEIPDTQPPLPSRITTDNYMNGRMVLVTQDMTLPAGWQINTADVHKAFPVSVRPAPGAEPLVFHVRAASLALLVHNRQNTAFGGDGYVLINDTVHVNFSTHNPNDNNPGAKVLITPGAEQDYTVKVYFPDTPENSGKTITVMGLLVS